MEVRRGAGDGGEMQRLVGRVGDGDVQQVRSGQRAPPEGQRRRRQQQRRAAARPPVPAPAPARLRARLRAPFLQASTTITSLSLTVPQIFC